MQKKENKFVAMHRRRKGARRVKRGPGKTGNISPEGKDPAEENIGYKLIRRGEPKCTQPDNQIQEEGERGRGTHFEECRCERQPMA